MQIIEKTIQNRLNAEMAIYQCVSLESVLTDNFPALLRAIIIQRNLLSFRQSGLRVWSLDELPGDRLTPETLGEIKADSYNSGDGHDTCRERKKKSTLSGNGTQSPARLDPSPHEHMGEFLP
jgi:hypothetical protein